MAYIKKAIRKSYKLEGTYTVEIAMILPIVLIIILAIVFFAFYLHDTCKIQLAVDRALYKWDVISDRDAYILEELEGNLFITNIKYVEEKKQGTNISISLGAEAKGTILDGGGLLPKGEIQIKEKGSVHRPTDTIRMVDLILDLGSKINLNIE